MHIFFAILPKNNLKRYGGIAMVTVLIRTTIIYLTLLIALRLTGKRQVGELEISELVTTFMISELATTPIQNLSIPLIYSLIPIILLLCTEIILSFLATKSATLKKMFFGNPSIIIKNGVINQRELSRLRIGINELLGELRSKDVSDISHVDYAILEQNGKLSVFLKSDRQQPCLKDFNKAGEQEGICHAIVIDGHINQTNLSYANKDSLWLESYLHTNNINMKKIFLMTVNDVGQISIIYKEEK